MNSLSAAGQAQKGTKRPDLYISSLDCHFYIAPYEQRFELRLAKPRKEPNDKICTFQGKLTVLTLRA